MVFPLGLLAGLAFGIAFHFVSAGSAADAGTIALLGLLLAANVRMPLATLGALALILALMRGAANAGGVTSETNLQLFAAGLVGAGYVAITLTMALTSAFLGTGTGPTIQWRAVAVRAFGSWIAAIGLMMGGALLAS